jgi:hypothetical protein
VEALPVERAWGELIVNGDDELLPALAVMSGVESLHRMTREGRDLEGLVVRGSDHLTAYNLYAEGFTVAGYIGEVYGLPRHLFDAERIAHWAEQRGVLVKALEDAALAMASVYRSVGMPLPQTLPIAGASMHRRFGDLLARYMPFDLVIEEETAEGHEARVSKTSVCGSWGAVAGSLRYFADRYGIPRAAIEGTQLSMDLVRQYAHRHEPELALDAERKHSPVLLRRRVTYYGFELSRESEPLPVFPPEHAAGARHLLAEAAAWAGWALAAGASPPWAPWAPMCASAAVRSCAGCTAACDSRAGDCGSSATASWPPGWCVTASLRIRSTPR